MRAKRFHAAGFAIALAMAAAWPRHGLAYRPFDGTDAAVTDPGEFELELGPAGLRRDDGGSTLVVPAAVLNLGIFQDWEAVLEGRGETPLSHGGRRALLGNAFSFKGVLREGVLQEKTGPSIATEFSALLPEIHGENGTGGSWSGILSQRWFEGAVTTHLNGLVALTRDRHADYFASTIVEGPFDWPVRPVSEIFYDRDFGTAETTVSGLIGAIWRVDEQMSADIGVRDARTNDRPVKEIRLGITIGFPVWHPAAR